MSVQGYLHSFETCGAVDGPGLRFVIFTQGCQLRCQYCHNPDTWKTGIGTVYTTDEILKEILKYRSYFTATGGGVTISGGEPLLQPEFVKELFLKLREEGIHTALDTAASVDLEISGPVYDASDLVLLDFKAFYEDNYRRVTGWDSKYMFDSLKYLDEKNIPVWIRLVIVPGLTDDLEEFKAMAEYLKQFKNIQKIEFNPFHKMGEYKWEELGIKYKLGDTPEPSDELVADVKAIFRA